MSGGLSSEAKTNRHGGPATLGTIDKKNLFLSERSRGSLIRGSGMLPSKNLPEHYAAASNEITGKVSRPDRGH